MRHLYQAYSPAPWDDKSRQLIKKIGLAIIKKNEKSKDLWISA